MICCTWRSSREFDRPCEPALNGAFRIRSPEVLYDSRRDSSAGSSHKEHDMRRPIIAFAIVAVAAVGAASVEGKAKSVTGTWTLTVEHIGLKLELVQKNDTVTGTLDWPHGDPIKLTGALTGDTLTFTGDSVGENFSVHVDSTGTLKADDTMAGTLKALFVDYNDAHEVVRKHDQEIPWTATRGEHGIVHFPR
jgi:hypothetical protein